MPTDVSPSYKLADVLLDGTFAEFVETRRAKGRSWRLIARDLYDATNVDVTYETLRSWFPEDRREQAS